MPILLREEAERVFFIARRMETSESDLSLGLGGAGGGGKMNPISSVPASTREQSTNDWLL